MQWIEVSVPTRSDEIDDVCAQLAELGAGGMVVEDETDFQQFLEQNHQYWDYVDDALEAVGMTQFVKHAPHLLSGGQKQRIALARALAVKPGILVMDDTTSAVDMETEKYIQAQLRQLPYDCTKLIIAQRISSVKDADLILILKDGVVTERGTHQELLRQRGYYYETYCLQNGITPDTAPQEVM